MIIFHIDDEKNLFFTELIVFYCANCVNCIVLSRCTPLSGYNVLRKNRVTFQLLIYLNYDLEFFTEI
jgi:hypothetical protein